MNATAGQMVSASFDAPFTNDGRFPHGVADPVFGPVHFGWLHGMRAVRNLRLGIAQLTDGARVITPYGDGVVSSSRRPFRRLIDRHVELGGHRYTLRRTWPGRARLIRDGVAVGWLRRTPFAAKDGRYQVLRWARPFDPAGVLIGHLLASGHEINGWR